jgi:site-specific DNA-adenine methylase
MSKINLFFNALLITGVLVYLHNYSSNNTTQYNQLGEANQVITVKDISNL